LRRLFGNPRRDVDDELSFHLEMRIRELIDRGHDPEQARRLAMERFGDIETRRREMLDITERRGRQMARTEYLSELRQDVGYAVRALRSKPGFAIVAVLTLALGIGANSAIFSVVYGVLLDSLPYRSPAELVTIQTAYPNGKNYTVSAADFMSIAAESRAFSGVAAYSNTSSTVLGLGEPKEITRANVTKSFFELLGVGVARGRLFTEDEHTPGRTNVLVVSHGFWQQELGGSSDVIGRSVTIGGVPNTIIGVLSPGVEFPAEARLFGPIAYDSLFSATTTTARRSEWLSVVGRLRGGETVEGGRRDVQRIGARLQQDFPQTNGTLTFTATSLTDALFGSVRTPLLVLLGAAGFVLLVACANVANLLLARATARESELAVRAALGAGRGRLVRQLLTESLVLAALGTMAGLALAWWGTRALVRARPVELPRLDQVSVNGTVVLFTIGIALLTGILFGILPALSSTGARLSQSLREGGRGALAGVRGRRVRGALVIAEMALAVVLLVGAGLLIRSFIELTRVDPGFDPDQAVSVRVSLAGPRYDEPAARTQFFNTLFEQLKALPGVTAVGGTSGLPLTGSAAILSFAVEGAPPPPPGVVGEIRVQVTTPEYFTAIGGKLLSGRLLNAYDRQDAAPVVLVNRAAIARWFPDGDPVGERVLIGPAREVVGVVDDVLQTSPTQPAEPEVYFPYTQNPTRTLRIVVRASSDPAALAPRIRQEIHALDPELALDAIAPMENLVANSIARPRFYTMLLGLFATVALTLAIVGIFGVMSYIVAQRRREISVRMALGASTEEVTRMVVSGALTLAGAGLLIGVIGAFALGGVLQNQLYGVRLADPVTLSGVVLILLGSAAMASYLPAARAARIDPGLALREN